MKIPFQTSVHIEVYDKNGELLKVIDDHNAETIWAKLHTPTTIYLDLITQPFSALLPADISEVNKTMFNYVDDLRSGELWVQFSNDAANKQYSATFNWTNESLDKSVYLYGLMSATEDGHLYTIFDLSSHPVEIPPNSVVAGRYLINYDNVTPTIPTESIKETTISQNEILGGFMTKTTPDMRSYKYTRVFQKTNDYLGVDTNDTDIDSVITVSFDSVDNLKRAWGEAAVGQLVYKFLSSGATGTAKAIRWIDYYRASQRARVVSGNVFYHIRSYLYPIVDGTNHCDRFFGYTDALSLGIREDAKEIYPWKINFTPASCITHSFRDTDWEYNNKGIYISKWISMTPRYIYNDFQNYTLQDVMYLYWDDNPHFTVFAYVYDTSKVDWTLYVNGVPYEGSVSTLNDGNRRIDFNLSGVSAGEGVVVLQATNAFWINMMQNGTDHIHVMSPRFIYSADKMYGYAIPFAGFLNNGSSSLNSNWISAGLASINGEIKDLNFKLSADDINHLGVVSGLPVDQIANKTDHQYWVWVKETEKHKLAGEIGVYNKAKIFTLWGRAGWDHTNTHVAPVYVTDNNIVAFRPTNVDEVNELSDYLGLEGILEDTFSLQYNDHIKVDTTNKEITFKDDKPLRVLVDSNKSYVVKEQGSSNYNVRIPESLVDYTEGTASIVIKEGRNYQSFVNSYDPFGDGSGVALYKFDGNADDASGNYNGTWYGTEQYDTGKFGQAAKFDGSSYVTIPSPSKSLPISISLWFKTTQKAHGSADWHNPTLIGFGTPGTNSNDFGIEIKNGYVGTFLGFGVEDSYYSNTYVSDGGWHNVVLTLHPNLATVYLDGNKLYERNINSNTIDNVTSWYIGVRYEYPGSLHSDSYFKGLIDQVRIFNRALTEEEVKYLCREMRPTTIETVATYDFETVVSPQENIRWLTVNYSSDSVFSAGEYLSTSISDGNGAIATDALETWTKYETYNVPDSDDTIVKDESAGTDLVASVDEVTLVPEYAVNQSDITLLSTDISFLEDQNFRFTIKVSSKADRYIIFTVPKVFEYNGETYYVDSDTILLTDGMHVLPIVQASVDDLDTLYALKKTHYIFTFDPSAASLHHVDTILTVYFKASKKSEILPYSIHFMSGYQGPRDFKHTPKFLLSLKADTSSGHLYSEYDGMIPTNLRGWNVWTNKNSVSVVDENTFEFNGSNYITSHTDVAPFIHLDVNEPFFLSFDVTVNALPDDYAVLWVIYRTDTHAGIRLCIDKYGQLFLESASNFADSHKIHRDFTAWTLRTGQTYKIELQFEYEKLRLFIDGKQAVYSARPNHYPGFTHNAVNFINIGCDYDGNSHYFTGRIANLFMLNSNVWFHEHKVVQNLDNPETNIVYDDGEAIIKVHLPFAIDNKIDVVDETGNHVDFCILDDNGFDLQDGSYGNLLYIKLTELRWSTNNISYTSLHRVPVNNLYVLGALYTTNGFNLDKFGVVGYEDLGISVITEPMRPYILTNTYKDAFITQTHILTDPQYNFWSKKAGFYNKYMYVRQDIHRVFHIVSSTSSKATAADSFFPFYAKLEDIKNKADRLVNWDGKYYVTDYKFYSSNSNSQIAFKYNIHGNLLDIFGMDSILYKQYTQFKAAKRYRSIFFKLYSNIQFTDLYTINTSPLIYSTLLQYTCPENAIWTGGCPKPTQLLNSLIVFSDPIKDIEPITNNSKLVVLDSNEASIDRPLIALKHNWFISNKNALNIRTYVVSSFESNLSCYTNKLGSHALTISSKPITFWIHTANRSRYATDNFNFMLIKDPELISLIGNKLIELPATEAAWIDDSYTTVALQGTEISHTLTNTLVIYKHKIGQFNGYLVDDDDAIYIYGDTTTQVSNVYSRLLSDRSSIDISNFSRNNVINYNIVNNRNIAQYTIPHLFNSYSLIHLLSIAEAYKRILYDKFEAYIKYPSSFETMLIHTEGEIPYDACITDTRVIPLINTDYNVLWDPNKIPANKINSFGKFTVIGASTNKEIHILPIMKVIDTVNNTEKIFAVNNYYEPEDVTDKLYNDLDNANKRYWMNKWYIHDILTFEFFDTLLATYNTDTYQFQYGWIVYTTNGIQSYDFATIKAISIMPDFNDDTLYQQVDYAWYIDGLDEYVTDISMLPDLGTHTVKVYNPSENAVSDIQVRIPLEDLPVENFTNGIVAYLNGSAIPTIYEKELQKLTNNFGEANKDYIWVKLPSINGKQTVTLELRDEPTPYTPNDVFDYYFDFELFDDSNWERIVYGNTLNSLSAWEENNLSERYAVWQDSYGDYRYILVNTHGQIRSEDQAFVFNSQYPAVLRSKFTFDRTKRWEIGYEADNEIFFDLYLTADTIRVKEEEVPFIYYDSTKAYYLLSPTIGDDNEFKLYYNEMSRLTDIDKVFRDRLKYNYLGHSHQDVAFTYVNNKHCPQPYQILPSDYGLRISNKGRYYYCTVDLNTYPHVPVSYSEIDAVKEIYVYTGSDFLNLVLEDNASIPLTNHQTVNIYNASVRYKDITHNGLKQSYTDYFNENKNGYIANDNISSQGILQSETTFAQLSRWDVHSDDSVLAYKVFTTSTSPFYYMTTVRNNMLSITNMYGSVNRDDVITYLGFAQHIPKPLKITYVTYTVPEHYVKLNMAANYSSVVNEIMSSDEISLNEVINDIMIDESTNAVMFRPKHTGIVTLQVYYESADDVSLFEPTTPIDPSWSDANIKERYRWYYYTHPLPDNHLALTNIPNTFYSYFKLSKLNEINITASDCAFYRLFSYAHSISVDGHHRTVGVDSKTSDHCPDTVYLTTNIYSNDIIDDNIHIRGMSVYNSYIGAPDTHGEVEEHVQYKVTNNYVPQKILYVGDEEAGSYNIDGYIFSKKRTVTMEIKVDPDVIDSTEQIWAVLPYKLFDTDKIRIVETSYKPMSALPHYPNNTPTLLSIQQESDQVRWKVSSLLDSYHNWFVKSYEVSSELTVPNDSHFNFVAKTGSSRKAKLYFVRVRSKQDLFVVTADKVNLVMENVHSAWYLVNTDTAQQPTNLRTRVDEWKQLNTLAADHKLLVTETTKSNAYMQMVQYVYIKGDTKIDRNLGEYQYDVVLSFRGKIDFKYVVDDVGSVTVDGVTVASVHGHGYFSYLFDGESKIIVYGRNECCDGHMSLYFRLPDMEDYELFSYDNLTAHGFTILQK